MAEETNGAYKIETAKEITAIQTDIKHIMATGEDLKILINNLSKQIKDDYVTKIEFNPVRNIVFGLIGVISVGVITALLSLILGVVR